MRIRLSSVNRAMVKRGVQWAAAFLLALGLASTATAETEDPSKLPMFGQPKITRPDKLKKADEDFIRSSTLRFGNRAAGSNALASQGWAALRAGQSDLAMQHFNQAWLLNSKNFRAFWGFGAIVSQRGQLSEAIEYLERARELLDEPSQRVALLCDLGTLHSEYAARLPRERELERAQHFVLANSRFAESLDNDPQYTTAWREWAFSLYEQERYSEAWLRVKRAQALRAEPFPPEFLKKLSTKMPEPK